LVLEAGRPRPRLQVAHLRLSTPRPRLLTARIGMSAMIRDGHAPQRSDRSLWLRLSSAVGRLQWRVGSLLNSHRFSDHGSARRIAFAIPRNQVTEPETPSQMHSGV
jgi:hypothetical protein